MGFIIFEKHPGDLLTIRNLKKKITTICIDQFNLQVNKIQLTADLRFKVYINIPLNGELCDSLDGVLSNLLEQHSILAYQIK